MFLVQVYGRVYRVVEPKRAQLKAATTNLEEKQAALAAAQSKLQEVRSCVRLDISSAYECITTCSI